MDILLTHGYFIYEDQVEAGVMKPYPPLGLLYITSYLRARGFEVGVLDSTFSSRDEFLSHLDSQESTAVGIYSTLMTRQNVLWMIAAAKQRGLTTIVGGPEPANYPEEYIDHGADFVVAGEGEQTLTELLPQISSGSSTHLDKTAGIIYRDISGNIVRTAPRAQIPKLDELPYPERSAIDIDKYLQTWKTHHGASSISLITARGCPYTCRWCSHSVYGFSHRRRSPENVADELQMLVQQYEPDQVWYADDVFTINRRWLFRYAALLKERGIKVPFETITREDRLNERVAETLAEMGCYRIWIGAESGSQRVLDKMERRTDAKRMREMIALLQRHGIRAGTFIMVGYEGETWQDIDETASHLMESMPDDLLTTLAYPIKGTAYYSDVEHLILADKPWAETSDRELTVAGRHSRRFYAHTQKWLRTELEGARLRTAGNRDYLAIAKQFLRTKKHRAAMYLSRAELERGRQ